MSQLIGLIDHDLKDFFIRKSEELCYFGNDFLKISPDLLCYGELNSFLGHLSENPSDCLIVTEPSGYRKNVISDGADGGVSNLGDKIGALALAESEILLAVLYDYLEAPSSGIEFPCPQYVKGEICSEKAVPLPVLASLYKENSDRHSIQICVGDKIVGFQSPAVFYLFLRLFSECGCAYCAIFSLEACLALTLVRFSDLQHPQPVTLDVSGFNEADYVSAGEPAVSQYILELYLVSDGAFDKLLGKLNLGRPVFPLPFLEHIGIAFKLLPSLDFLLTESVIALLARLSYDGEIKQKLRPAIGDSHKQTFEAKNTFMFKMGEYTSDILNGSPCLTEVRIIKNETDIIIFGICPHADPVPQLYRYAPQSLAPSHRGVLEETVEDILLRIHQNGGCGILCTENIFYSKIGKKYQTLEHRKTTVKSVTPVLYAKCTPVGHPYIGKYVCYGLHGSREIFIIEKFFDFRNKRSNFVYRHGRECVFWWYLKLLNFCQFGKNPCLFLCPYTTKSLTCET